MKQIDLKPKEEPKPRKGHQHGIRWSDHELQMIDELATAYKIMYGDKPNRSATLKYLVRSAFSLLSEGRKI